MTKDLYVKNISPEATEEDLRKLFGVAGKVSYIHLVKDDKTGQFRGFGYVKMASEAEAKEAVTCLDGARLIDRIISVAPARPRSAEKEIPAPPAGRDEGGKRRRGRRG